MFIDRAKIKLRSGDGGNGAVTFRHAPYVPMGGPDGGDGGDGGNIIFLADEGLSTLMDFKYKKNYVADNGENGRRRKQYGKKGEDLVIRVPIGTVVIDDATGRPMADLVRHNQKVLLLRGGKGGKGNVHFKNSVRQAPNFGIAGGSGMEVTVILSLKMIADVGLVGFPNAGKSTFLSVTTSAKPKIGNYDFTTIATNLGVASVYGESFTIADIAGIIKGASEGAGMGDAFLKHIERTRILLHLIDASNPERDLYEAYLTINHELGAFNPKLLKKEQIVVVTKMDLLDLTKEKIRKEAMDAGFSEDEADKIFKEEAPLEWAYFSFIEKMKEFDVKVFEVSSVKNEGVQEVLKYLLERLSNIEKEPLVTADELYDPGLTKSKDEYEKIDIEREGRVYVLSGEKLYKIFDSTNFNDMGSIRYLYNHIEKTGAIKAMKEMGLSDGDIVKIKDYEFDFFDEENTDD